MKIVCLFCMAVLLASCASVGAQEARADRQIGWLTGNCLAIRDPDLAGATAITVVDLAHDNRETHGIINAKASSGKDCQALLPDREEVNRGSGYFFYVVKLEAPVDLGIGLVGRGTTDKLEFGYCTTAEGLQFTVRDDGRSVWEGYYYLGYDTEVTCAEGPGD